MFSFLSSLSFLYAFTIALLLWYGAVYYKGFTKNGFQKRRFPLVFLTITIACGSFLYFNIHAPLRLHTFSNLDHHFIRHDGFRVSHRIELGRNDTINNKTNSFNRFILEREGGQLRVNAHYAEEPFYISSGKTYRIASVVYPTLRHTIRVGFGQVNVNISTTQDNKYDLRINNELIGQVSKTIKKGSTAWNLFREDTSFINSTWYTDDRLISGLRNISLVRDNVSREESGELKYFFSGRIFQQATSLYYDEKALDPNDLSFIAGIPDHSTIAWGLGFLDNNRNQFRVNYLAVDSFDLSIRFPVAYPLSEEKAKDGSTDWSSHRVNKFLVADTKDLLDLPPVFGEGFLFSLFSGDSTLDFQPVLLSYKKDRANAPLQMGARFLNKTSSAIVISGNQLLLPASTAGFTWIFSLQNTFDWKLGNQVFSASTWQWLLYGSLFFLFVMVFAASWLQPANQLSWVWQLLSCVTMVMLTTRFFLFWRYKSFPPYESMDLPSLQQLNSFWNFGIILLSGFMLSFIFGWKIIKYLAAAIPGKWGNNFKRSFSSKGQKELISETNFTNTINRIPFFKRRSTKTLYFFSWVLLLLAGGSIAAINDFDPTTCRHLAIILVLFYFLFLYLSYRHSPLVAAAEKSWWVISTGRLSDILVNNPVKVLLSVSLLGLFAFVDMGFAIIFLNFLLFNEAFLCINYGIAGLSAGSKRNAFLFGVFGAIYMTLFVINLIAGPFIFKWLLELPQLLYTAGYFLFAILVAYMLTRLFRYSGRKRVLLGWGSGIFLFICAYLFFPKERILEKASITQYRIDVMTMPVDLAIKKAYEDGKTYEPVIRAAQNQWFINTFIYEKNNPSVNSTGFHLLPHAPQNKGAKYNAQATDLVTSRFLLAEHGRWSVLLYILLLLLPIILLASFYKLYPDFTNRINTGYPTITTGFSLLNYLLVTALLVILAATGRYIFFGQDLPFGSILSKQSILFPSALLIVVVLLFKNISLERYPNRKKFVPGIIVFTGLAGLLFFVKPIYNKNREFAVSDLAKDLDNYIQLRVQPVFDEIDTAKATRKLSILEKDRLFSDRVKELVMSGGLKDAGEFFTQEISQYTRSSFSKHLDQNRMLYLDLHSGKPQLAVNDNFFRVEPPPHLQQSWSGNVFSDPANYNISLWNESGNSLISKRISSYAVEQDMQLTQGLMLAFRKKTDDQSDELCLVNSTGAILQLKNELRQISLKNNDTLVLHNPDKFMLPAQSGEKERILVIQPDAFMRNYFVNGNRFYAYPMGNDFIWARNFSESISSEYAVRGRSGQDVFLSLDAALTDSLSVKIRQMLNTDTAYKKGAEYGICIADADGRLIAMPDFIKGLERPDPNDKAAFNMATRGENGFISQSLLRKEIGNINLLRMNPGPGSTLKPIVFSSIASQLNLNWDAFAAEGFSQKQDFFGGEKVAEYDFEKNNGRIASVADYLKYSDNYYYADLILLGSYTKQDLQTLLLKHFARQNPEGSMHWPYFSYNGQQYWLNGFENWPGYANGKANFGSDSSFISTGLFNNYGIYTYRQGRGFEKFNAAYDSKLLRNAYKKSGFILPEYALFDQKGTGMDMSKPNEVFMSAFRGHVKGSSQVMIPPVKMLDAFGKLVTQNRSYSLTLNPGAIAPTFSPFYVDNGVTYSSFLTLMKESVFTGMREALFHGTAARLGSMLKDGSPYYYYAKTGTTGDEESTKKSKLFTIIISQKDLSDPNFNFRKNKFYTIYFTSQNGPAKQNEEFQAVVIKYIESSAAFKSYMNRGNQ